jgi:hypothetical protein
MRKGILLLFFLISISRIFSQSITPFTINIAGFTSIQSGYSLTVSTGETISITNFKAPNGESLNSGFLQNNPPLVTGIEELLNKIGDNEVNITPNPTNTITNLITNLIQPGQLQYQILDVGSKLLYRSQSQNALSTKQTIIELQNYPAGIYYILVFFKPNSGIAKTGIYKIVKL